MLSNEDKREFKRLFITNFLSTWCAMNYKESCALGKYDTLLNPPIEDAEILSDSAWRAYKKNYDGDLT